MMKKMVIILFLLAQGSLQAAQMNITQPKEATLSMQNIDEKINAAVQPSIKDIPVQVQNFVGKEEIINLDDLDSISSESFGDLRAKAKQNGDSLILARVVTHNKDRSPNFDYYDAYNFNQWRFGNYPLSGRQLQVVHSKSPNNNLQIQDDIQYFVYDPEKSQKGFVWAFSENNFLRNQLYRLMIEANQSFDAGLRVQAYYNIGGLYFDTNSGVFNFKLARKYYEKAAQQTVDPKIQINALLRLGQTYYLRDGGVEPDNAQAKKYLEPVARQDELPWAKAQAETILGSILFGEENYEQARKYFESAANQTINVHAARLAKNALEQIEEKIKKNVMND